MQQNGIPVCLKTVIKKFGGNVMKKQILAVSALLCAGVMVVPFAACGQKEAEAASYVSLDINPSIELTLDKNDKVLSVYGANEDGQVLLYEEEGIVGADVKTAVEKITALAVELGYLDENNKVVETSVSSEKKDLLEKVNASVTATAESLNLSVTCDGEGAYSLLRKMEQLKERFPDNSAIRNLTPDKMKLVLSATEDGSISVEAAAELDTSELVKRISDAHQKTEEYATAAYNKIKSEASAAYDLAVGDVSDLIYTSYYTAHHLNNTYYAVSYQSYKYSARSLKVVSDALVFAEKACEYPLSEVQIAAASEALGLGSDVSALKNSDGDITVNSIYAYADKLFKNSEASVELDKIKTDLNAALDKAESELQEIIDEESVEYEAEINEVKEKLGLIVGEIEKVTALIPDALKTQLQTMVNNAKEFIAEAGKVMEDGKITSDEVRALAEKLEKKAGEAREKMDGDLTEKEREEVKAKQEKAVSELTAAKKKMEDAISKAEQEAKAKLAELKEARQSK